MRYEGDPNLVPNHSSGAAAVWWFILAITAARLLYLGVFSPFTLTEDEAHYWHWAQYLDWSYYSKGPGVAWAIAASTALLGNTEFAVRTPAVLFSALGTLAAAGLARDIFGGRRIPLMAAIAYQAMPGFHLTGLLMTIDGPMLACWTIAAWAGWRAMIRGVGPAWVVLGLAVAVGFLFKYTTALFVPGIVLFAVLARGRVPTPRLAAVLSGVGAALLGLLPIAIWNAGHDWATVRHLIGQLGLPGGDIDVMPATPGPVWSPLWTLEVPLFALLVGGAPVVLALQDAINTRRRRDAAPPSGPAASAGRLYLACLAAPVAAFYLIVTLFTGLEANWILPALVPLVPLAAKAAADGVASLDRGVRSAWHAALWTLAVMLVGVPVLGGLAARGERPLGIPLGRVTGADRLADQAAALATDLRDDTGETTFFMTVHYGRASLLTFYLPGHPTVFSASAQTGGRRSQIDLWPDTDLSRADVIERLRGRPAVLFGGETAPWPLVFDRVEALGPLPAEPKASRSTWLGFGFRGFDAIDGALARPERVP